ncbi:hypothetical protein [Acidithiobacillus sp.]
MVGEGIDSFGIGPQQGLASLDHIYILSAFWAFPLLWLAWRNSRPTRAQGTGLHG